MRKISGLFLFILFSTLFLTACGLIGASPDTCDGEGMLFKDDFNGDQDCGWRQYSQGGAVVEIADGVLSVSTSQPGQIWWTNPGREFDNVVITATARQVSGPDNNAYGVICRYQDENNFYIFLISGDGYYAIGKYQTGSDQITYLTDNGQYVFSDVINQGVATNLIRATCSGNQLSLSVNGIPLTTIEDPTFVRGDVGVGVSTLEPGAAVVHFDDFSVAVP
ncbi:MAG TPA: hypothetical protein EYP41_16160 [Anaerolineae bacterium]|nr:hypothetical protein [Anaerolineae bacterium]HIP72640.1 hypothetical protein [Anaerolineae bacterium]